MMKLLHGSATAALLAGLASAQSVIDSLSFGHHGLVSADHTTVQGWQVVGQDYQPQLLSDRVILTPPAPGSKRGGLISHNTISHGDFKAEVEFRASGQERGNGNFDIWFTRQPLDRLPSIYTVDSFDGFALVVDQYAGSAGSIRGFLNDGSNNYRSHHNVDSLAFGHCSFAFRNLGRMAPLTIQQDGNGLEVLIDGTSCFKSDNVRLPTGYYITIGAVSAENPDSFEVGKFTFTSLPNSGQGSYQQAPPSSFQNNQVPPAYQNRNQQQQQQQQQQQARDSPDPLNYLSPEKVQSLLDKLEVLQFSVNHLSRQIQDVEDRAGNRHSEIINTAASTGGSGSGSNDVLTAMDHIFQGLNERITGIENTLNRVQRDVESRDYQKTLNDLQSALRDTQTNLLSTLPQSMSHIVTSSSPKLGMFIFVVLAFQVMLAGAYIVYKRRRANAPKKFL